MNYFSISQLQEFSGIKAHTIRIWEQRYNALSPTRSEGNTRYYDNNQLRRLLNIVSLSQDGNKVSKLCAMSDEMLQGLLEIKLKSTSQENENHEYLVSQLIVAATEFDEVHFERIFSKSLIRLGMRGTYTYVIYPMLTRMGLMWSADSISPAHEHFSCSLIKQKLYSAINALPPAKESANCWLLFLPENEFHEIGLLFSNYLLRQAGKRVIYLGSNLPFNTLENTIEATDPAHLLFFLVHHNKPEESQDYLSSLKSNFGKTKIHLSGSEKFLGKLNISSEFNWIRSVADFEEHLA